MLYQIKQASYDDIKTMVDWAANEGWNPGILDASAFLQIDPNGFFVGYIGDELVSCISNVKYSDAFSFVGFYIVKPKYRSKGFGYKIAQHAINYSSNCNIGLDGVIEMQDKYKEYGFHFAHMNLRYCLEHNTIKNYQHSNLIRASSLPINFILNYDKQFFPSPRNTFLTNWLFMFNAKSLVYYDNTIKGYGVIRKCRTGYKIGPLFSDNRHIANIIFQGLCSLSAQNEPVYLDIPEPNYESKLLVEELAMKPVFKTARMYNKIIPEISIDRTFGLTSFEVG